MLGSAALEVAMPDALSLRSPALLDAAGAAALVASHAAVANHFNVQRHLIRRTLKTLRAAAFADWRQIAAA